MHEADHLISTIDPISGHNIGDATSHPSLLDDNLTIYFESEVTPQAFLKMPVNHPFKLSPGKPSEEHDRGGFEQMLLTCKSGLLRLLRA